MSLPNGKHRARAKSAALGLTSTGKEQVGVEFEILTDGHVGTSITWYGYFTEDTTERTIKSLRICGWAGTELDNLNGIDSNEVELEVEEDTYNGKTSAKVKWINKPGGLAMKSQLDPVQARSFAQRMKGAIAALDKATGTKPAQRPAARAPARNDDPPMPDDRDAPPPY